jgi:hypothetical protein
MLIEGEGTEVEEIRLSTWEGFEREVLSKIQTTGKKRAESGAYVSDVLFRGHASAEWRLKTTLERYSEQKSTVLDYYTTMQAVKPIVHSFTGRSWELGENSGGKEASSGLPPAGYEFMIYLRHHGFPSPLLDWTRSPYVAAFFAFSSRNPKDGEVAIYSYIEHYGGGKTWSSDKARIIALGPYVTTHTRHYNQQSEYTVCYERVGGGDAYGNHEEAVGQGESGQDLITKYVLPKSERANVLERLDLMNVNAYSLFGHEESLMEMLAYREMERRRDL